ncbi:MAG TPA: carbohydrate porin [Verrucomicrobiae bacterium]|nr:carbohydrate porin [Verrucomicrobiae bacterium]
MNILVVDVGGTHVKILAAGQDMPRQFDSGPTLTPQKMVSQVQKLACDWKYDAVSIGYPGPVLRGRPVSEPYHLGAGWVGFNFEAAFKLPVKVVNDAAMQALGCYQGGKMLFLGLGTGLGSTMIVDGVVEPMELGHLPYKQATFEDYVGIQGLEQHGQNEWRQYVTDVVKRLVAALEPDEVVLGGGNVHKLETLPIGCRAGDNGNAFQGGFRLWEAPGKPISLGVAMVLLALVLIGPARAQEMPLPSASSITVTNMNLGAGMNTNTAIGFFGAPSSGSPQTPVNLRPFQLALPREHLFGDWYGLRPKLDAQGIIPTLTFVTDIAGNPTGGKSQGVAEADNLGLDLLFDLDKLVGLEGGSFLVSMSQRSGESLSANRVGNVFTIQQVYGGQTFHLIDVAYLQKLFDDRVEIRLGRIATGDDFLVSQYNYLFMQNGFDGNPVGIFFNSPGMTAYPNATWGALLKARPTNRTYVMGGVYNGDPSLRDIDHNGADMSMNGPVFVIGEAGYQLNGLPGDSRRLGNYKAGFWYDNSEFTDYNSVGHAQPPGTKRGNWGVYTLFDQVLVPFGEPASNRGFGVFGSFLASPDESVSQMPYFFTAGVASRGMFESRPIDVAGFGVVFGSFSSDLSNAQQREQLLDPATGVQDYETVFEWTYRFNLRKGAVFFQPDVQYVINPGGKGHINDALVLGCQIGINL